MPSRPLLRLVTILAVVLATGPAVAEICAECDLCPMEATAGVTDCHDGGNAIEAADSCRLDVNSGEAITRTTPGFRLRSELILSAAQRFARPTLPAAGHALRAPTAPVWNSDLITLFGSQLL